jgi:hypothetical protein
MKTTILAASLAAVMASVPVMAREAAHEAFRGAHAQATRAHVHAAPAPLQLPPGYWGRAHPTAPFYGDSTDPDPFIRGQILRDIPEQYHSGY